MPGTIFVPATPTDFGTGGTKRVQPGKRSFLKLRLTKKESSLNIEKELIKI